MMRSREINSEDLAVAEVNLKNSPNDEHTSTERDSVLVLYHNIYPPSLFKFGSVFSCLFSMELEIHASNFVTRMCNVCTGMLSLPE